MSETNLVLSGLVIPVGSGRGITQSITPIDNGDLRRTVNGTLVDTTRAVNQKYSTSIKCSDQGSPPFAQVWKGSEMEISCVAKIRQMTDAAMVVTLTRVPVEASIVGMKSDGTRIDADSLDDMDVTFSEDVIMVEFCPILEMMVTNYSVDEDEYGATTGWQLDLEEV